MLAKHNCFNGRGAIDIDNIPVQLSLADCQSLCLDTPGCQGVVVRRGSTSTTDCYRRSSIDTLRCEAPSPSFDLYYDPNYYGLTPEIFAAVINGAYSTALYGAPGGLDASTMRLIWPALLPDGARASIRARCDSPIDWDEPGHSIFYMPQFLQHNALWIHSPMAQLRSTYSDNEWVEVTHCGYRWEHVTSRTPMWFFAAPGSGMRVNIGRSARMGVMTDANGGATMEGHLALTHGNIDLAASLLNLDLSSYDSVQFPLYHGGSWRGERFTEIVMLRMISEEDFVTQHLPSMKCGPFGALRACQSGEAAVVQQSQLCSAAVSNAVSSVIDASGCDLHTSWGRR